MACRCQRGAGRAAPLVCATALTVAAFCLLAGAPAAAHEASRPVALAEEMHLISKSLDDLLGELSLIKREATGRLSQVKRLAVSGEAAEQQAERIRQTKVSRFVLGRVQELERESMTMRAELARIFKLMPATGEQSGAPAAQPAPVRHSPAQLADQPALSEAEQEREAQRLGIDLDALKKLGAELEGEIEARAQAEPETLRGVHEQVIKLFDNMVQNYLGNMRRAINRMNRLMESRRAMLTINQPRQQPGEPAQLMGAHHEASSERFQSSSEAILEQLQSLSREVREFAPKWARALGSRQSPLFDRIPARGVELWRDFWDTVRKQVRRINQEFLQLSRDMTRAITGREPITSQPAPTNTIRITANGQAGSASLDISRRPYLYAAAPAAAAADDEQRASEELRALAKQFQQFYDKVGATLSEQQQKLDAAAAAADQKQPANGEPKEAVGQQQQLVYDDQDDEATRQELTRNVALRQQIQQEINVFGSIFDIMRTFIVRLRESASSIVRDVLSPSGSNLTNNNDNNPVTPGPSVKPQVDKLLEDTINSQRNINSQARPMLLPNSRPALNPERPRQP